MMRQRSRHAPQRVSIGPLAESGVIRFSERPRCGSPSYTMFGDSAFKLSGCQPAACRGGSVGEHSDVTPLLIGIIRSAFRYRDWLAHGRYWVAKLGRRYDFETLHDIGRDVEMAFPFLRT